MKYLTLVLLSLVLTACNSDDAPEVRIVSASHSGAGCPSGTASIILQEDGRTLSVLFDTYRAEAGIGTGPTNMSPGLTSARVACNIAVSLHIPSGYQAFLIGADFRGSVSLPAGAVAEFDREYFFAGDSSPILTAIWRGELENTNVEIFDDLYADSNSRSRCGEDVTLRNNTSLYIAADADADTALIEIDSFDYQHQQNRTQFDYQFSYARCS